MRRRQTDGERLRVWRREYNRANRATLQENSLRRRARKVTTQVERVDLRAVAVRDASTCYLCGRVLTSKELSIDHVIPLARGGSHTEDNLRVACRSGNVRKGTRLLAELPPTFRCTD